VVVCTPQKLLAALEIIDMGQIFYITAIPSQRSFFQVESVKTRSHYKSKERDQHYFCFEHYCPCVDFWFQNILPTGENLLCKHILAARIGFAIGKCELKQIDDFQYAEILCS